jgi:hypothetical protein
MASELFAATIFLILFLVFLNKYNDLESKPQCRVLDFTNVKYIINPIATLAYTDSIQTSIVVTNLTVPMEIRLTTAEFIIYEINRSFNDPTICKPLKLMILNNSGQNVTLASTGGGVTVVHSASSSIPTGAARTYSITVSPDGTSLTYTGGADFF